MEHIFECVILIFFCICLYRVFCKRPKIKVVKAPTTKEIRRQRKKDRRMRKIKRKFKLPHSCRFLLLNDSLLFFNPFYHTAVGFIFVPAVIIDPHEQDFSAISVKHLRVLPVFDLPDRSIGCFIVFQFHHQRRLVRMRQRQAS